MNLKDNYIYIKTDQQLQTEMNAINDLPYWVVDTETTGLDPHSDKVVLIQIGNRHVQFIIDVREVDPEPLREKLEDENFRKWLQNATFDYLMLKGSFGITMEGMRDTLLAEKVITLGKSRSGFSMKDLAKKYLSVELDKELQTSFIGHTGDFSRAQLRYAALDCVIPDLIFDHQAKILKREKLERAFKIECNSIPSFGDITFYGMQLDQDAWRANIEEEQEKSDFARNRFLDEVQDYTEPNLFGDSSLNPSSSAQVLELFERMYPGEMVDQHGKPSTGERILTSALRKGKGRDAIKWILEYREHEKKVGTYGHTYLNNVHEKTKRFHPRMNQLGTFTGRPAGRRPNMLNIPAEARYRTPWIAGSGRKMITVDYGACELRIMASMSKDPVMCKGFNDGLDYHTYTAAEFIKEGSKPVAYADVTKAQRKVAKVINFGLAYGMKSGKLADTINIIKELAKEYINSFENKFKRLVAWLKENQDGTITKAYSETHLGRRRYFFIPVTPWEVENADKFVPTYGSEGELTYQYGGKSLAYDPGNPWDKNLPDNIRDYHMKISQIKREGGNFPVQGGNADITKIAMYEIRKYIKELESKENKGNYLAHIALQVYDEIVVDCPEQYADHLAKKVEEIMVKAGEEVITEVPVVTDCIIADSWVKG